MSGQHQRQHRAGPPRTAAPGRARPPGRRARPRAAPAPAPGRPRPPGRRLDGHQAAASGSSSTGRAAGAASPGRAWPTGRRDRGRQQHEPGRREAAAATRPTTAAWPTSATAGGSSTSPARPPGRRLEAASTRAHRSARRKALPRCYATGRKTGTDRGTSISSSCRVLAIERNARTPLNGIYRCARCCALAGLIFRPYSAERLAQRD